jgi:hypothetical protein
MTYKVIVRPEAALEIQEAFDWYEERSEGLGLEFLRVADACLSGVQRNPTSHQMVHEQSVARSCVSSLMRSSTSLEETLSLFLRALTSSVVRRTGRAAPMSFNLE